MSSNSFYEVCVVVPVYQEFATLSAYELISLQQCLRVFKNYSISLVGPAHLHWHDYHAFFQDKGIRYTVQTFSSKYFENVGGYSRLLLSATFYIRFQAFQFMLIYQLDAFAFSDELPLWCKAGYDYIGAPWFEGFSDTREDALLIGAGNGGFSLRKISAQLHVLYSFSYISPPVQNWRQRMKAAPQGFERVKQAAGFAKDLLFRNNTYWRFNSFAGFEDQFWSLVAPRNFSWYKVAGAEEAMKFSIEMQPRRVFELNNRRLPFGCHAWWKYDLEFWKPYIRASGYDV